MVDKMHNNKYVRLCLDLKSYSAQVEIYDEKGKVQATNSYIGVKFVETRGRVRIDIESLKLNPEVMCVFIEGAITASFKDGVLKIE
jgi:hypothetical protein